VRLPRLELDGGQVAPPLQLGKAEDAAVEADRGLDVGGGDRDEVGAGDERCGRGHGRLLRVVVSASRARVSRIRRSPPGVLDIPSVGRAVT
jgi:hypothetical protein